jgi:hypothetical protein
MLDPKQAEPHGELIMKSLLSLSALPLAAMCTVAFVLTVKPALVAAAEGNSSSNEYCRMDYVSGMRQCGFATLEQCKAATSGREGDCARNPFLGRSEQAYAHAPEGGQRTRK